MKQLFAYLTNSALDAQTRRQWLQAQMLQSDVPIVSEIFNTQNPDLVLGSFYFAQHSDLTTSYKTDFDENGKGDCIICYGNIDHKQKQGSQADRDSIARVQCAPTLVQLLEKQGGNFISQVKGSALYMAWDHKNRVLHVGKDPFNPATLYWRHTQDGLLVTTDLRFLRLLSPQPITLSESGLASWLSGYPNPAISLFNEVEVLESGMRLEITNNLSISKHRFWDINPAFKIVLPKQEDYNAQFHALLQESVRVACQTEKQTLVSQMSGGLDSTSVTSLATRLAKSQGKQLWPLSHLYSQAEYCDESGLIQQMLDYLQVENKLQLTVDGAQDRKFLTLYPTALDSPATVLSPRYIHELATVKTSGADVLLSGNGGDEICWGHSVAYTQRLRDGDFAVLKEVSQACQLVGMSRKTTMLNLFVKPFIPTILLNLLGAKPANQKQINLPVWLSPKAQALAIEQTQITNPFDQNKDPVGYNRYHSLKTTATYNAMRSYQQLSDRFDIDVRHPFFNTLLAEFSFAVPAKQLIQGPYPKWLLRNSMAQQLPAIVCWNVKKVTFDQHFGNLVRENANDIRPLFKHNKLTELGLIERERLLAEFERVVNDRSYPLHVDLLYAILTYSWLNSHFPEQ